MKDTLPAAAAPEHASQPGRGDSGGPLVSVARSRPALSMLTPWAASLLAGVVAVALRLFELWRHPFDGLYGQDPYYYLARARILADILADPEKLATWVGGGMPSFSTWPLGYMLQMAALFPLLGWGPAAGQVVNLAGASITCASTALLTGRVLGRRYGAVPTFAGCLAAGAAIAFGAVHLRASLLVMSDVSGLAWGTLGVLLALDSASSRGRRAVRLALAAGLVIGLAAITRYQFALLLLPLFGYWAALSLEEKRSTPPQTARSSRPRLLALVVLAALVPLGLQLLHNLTHPVDLSAIPVLETWSPANFFARTFQTPDGTLSFVHNMATYYFAAPPAQWQLLGPGLALAALAGALLLLKQEWSRLALLGSWWLVFALFFSGTVYQADRFALSCLPPLAVLSGCGIAGALQAVTSGQSPRAIRVLATILVLTASANLLFMARGAGSLFAAAQAIKESDLRTTTAIEAYQAKGGHNLPVISFGLTATLRYYTNLPASELWFLRATDAELLLSGRPRDGVRGLLVLPAGDFAARWRGMPMLDTYSWLEGRYSLVPLKEVGGYVLYEIR